MLLRLIVGGQTTLENECDENTEGKIRSRVLSIAQDLVYSVSGGKKWTPKHIGLASTLHQATRSKGLVRLFNKTGHCLSYEQVLQLDNSLAESTFKSLDETIGSVISPKVGADNFVQYTSDNIDILDETLDGKTLSMQPRWQCGKDVKHQTNLSKTLSHHRDTH